MVFLSTYKSSRVLGPNAFKSGALKARAVSEYYFQRSWNMQFVFIVFGEYRLYMVLVPFIYFFHRWHVDRIDSIEETEKVLIKRWGGSVDAVRKNLTPAEQIISRAYHERERYHSFFAPTEFYVAPEGSPLPGASGH
eukprot:GILI01007025.1.p1 GENE.GILI01007025.1~~GILI01007025.1.p1  ORF type:complete len:149 (-),score=34.85 GILI01007025.1:138-548(-)